MVVILVGWNSLELMLVAAVNGGATPLGHVIIFDILLL